MAVTEDEKQAAMAAMSAAIVNAVQHAQAAGLATEDVYYVLAAAIGYAAANESPSAQLTNAALAFCQQVMVDTAAEVFNRPRKSQVN